MVTRPNQAWLADITYIRMLTGFLYLTVLLDLFARRVICWALSERIDHDHELTLAALRMAVEEREPPEDCIHHSDHGVQYACQAYVEELNRAGMTISKAGNANP